MEKNCAYCGQPFEAKGRGRFCSDSHRVMGYRQKKGLPLTPFKTGQGRADVVEKLEQEVKRLKAENELGQRNLLAAASIVQGYYKGRQKDPKLIELAKDFITKFQAQNPTSGIGIPTEPPKKPKSSTIETPPEIQSWIDAMRKK